MGGFFPKVSLCPARLTGDPNRDIMRSSMREDYSVNSTVLLLRKLENCKEIKKWQDL